MPSCNIVGCGARKRKDVTKITLHRLPRNKVKKRKWLEIIGIENLRPNTKDVVICSLHFEENAFNRTLDIVRLRDDALPSRHLLPSTYPENAAADLNDNHQLSVGAPCASSLFSPIAPNVSQTQYSEAVSQHLMEPGPSSSSDFMVKDQPVEIIEKLEKNARSKRKKSKVLMKKFGDKIKKFAISDT